MGRALILMLVTILSGLLLYWLLAPRFLSPTASVTTPNASTPNATTPPVPTTGASVQAGGTQTPAATSDVNTAPAVTTPRSGQQRETDDREAKRGPLYRWIRENLKDVLVGWQPDPKDPATLELYAANDDPQVVMQLLTAVVQPYALKYGFNHVVFYLPNSPGSIEHYRLDAEATYDNGVWQLFRK